MTGPTDATAANRAELAALDADAAVWRTAQVIDHDPAPCQDSVSIAEDVLEVLPALLREDSPAGDALRERLGLRWDQWPRDDDLGAISMQAMSGEPSVRWLTSNQEPLP